MPPMMRGAQTFTQHADTPNKTFPLLCMHVQHLLAAWCEYQIGSQKPAARLVLTRPRSK